jgi:hypothetical protein
MSGKRYSSSSRLVRHTVAIRTTSRGKGSKLASDRMSRTRFARVAAVKCDGYNNYKFCNYFDRALGLSIITDAPISCGDLAGPWALSN